MTREIPARLRSPESITERQVEIGRLIRSVQEEYLVDGAMVYGVVHDWYDDELDAAVEFEHHRTYALITVIDGDADDAFRVDLQHEDAAVRWYDDARFLDVTRPEIVDTEDYLRCVAGVLQRRLNERGADEFAQIAHEYLMPDYDVLEPRIARIATRHHKSIEKRDRAVDKLARRIVHGAWWSCQRYSRVSPDTGRRYLDKEYVTTQLTTWVLAHPHYGGAMPLDVSVVVHDASDSSDEAQYDI